MLGAVVAASWLLAPRVAVAVCDVTPMGGLAFGERIRDVEVVGDLAYVAAGPHGLVVIDVSDTAAMQLVSALDLGAYAHDVEVSGSVVFVAASDVAGLAGLYAVDVTDPALPVQIGKLDGSFTQVTLDGGTAWVVDPSSGLHGVDVSTPAAPSVTGSLDLAGQETDVEVAGGWIYLTVLGDDGVAGVHVVDASTPSALSVVGSLATGGRLPVDLEVDSGVALVPAIGAGPRGLLVLDVSSGGAPSETAFLRQPNARDVRRLGPRAYFAFGIDPSFGGGAGGLQVIDVSNPAMPVVIGEADTSIDESTGLAVVSRPDGDWVYVSVSGILAGLRSFRVSSCPTVASGALPVQTVPLTLDVPVAFELRGSPSLDVTDYDVGSLAFGPLGAPVSLASGLAPIVQDTDGDGYDDLVVHFQTGGAGLDPTAQQACVEGLVAGVEFIACDWVVVDLPPLAHLDADLGDGIVPVSTFFSAEGSRDPEGGALTYAWLFDDGYSGGRSTLHRGFLGSASLQLTLTVSDPLGQQDVVSTEVHIYFDADGDGIHDGHEMVNGNPVDHDGDGTPDHLDLDSDDDGIPDADEDLNHNGWLDPVDPELRETDRINPDTDGDGVLDGRELQHGTDPRDALDFPGATSLPTLGPWVMGLQVAMLVLGGRRSLRIRAAHVRRTGCLR